MNAIKILVLGLLLGIVVGAGESMAASKANNTRMDSAAGVKVKVILLNPKTDGDLRFELVLDTHSVNLESYDLKTISVLRDGSGNVYSPKAVENKGSDHHRQSTLVFAKPGGGAERLELVIKDVAGVKERIFRWDLP